MWENKNNHLAFSASVNRVWICICRLTCPNISQFSEIVEAEKLSFSLYCSLYVIHHIKKTEWRHIYKLKTFIGGHLWNLYLCPYSYISHSYLLRPAAHWSYQESFWSGTVGPCRTSRATEGSLKAARRTRTRSPTRQQGDHTVCLRPAARGPGTSGSPRSLCSSHKGPLVWAKEKKRRSIGNM